MNKDWIEGEKIHPETRRKQQERERKKRSTRSKEKQFEDLCCNERFWNVRCDYAQNLFYTLLFSECYRQFKGFF